MEPTTTAVPTPSASTIQTDFKTVVAQANTGDKAALTSLRQKLDDNPNIWADIGRIALESERMLIERIAGGDRLVEEAVRRTLDQMRTDLTTGSSPAEKMAADRVVVAWLFLQLADKALAADGGAALPQAQFTLKKHEVASRQYHAAVKSLHDVQERLPKAQPEKDSSSTGLRIFGGESGPTNSPLPPTGTCTKP
jgi:hypothetical protein